MRSDETWGHCVECLRMTNIITGVTSVVVLVAAILTAIVSTFFLPECINGTPNGLFGPCDCPIAFSGDGCEFENCVNGYENNGICLCENLWHGDFCNICNAVNQEKCLGECLSGVNGTMDHYYGDKCEFYCFIEDPARGVCTSDGPQCTQDFTGPNCSFACSDCTTNQECIVDASGKPKCVCAEEYYNFPHCNVTCQTAAVCPGDVPCTTTCSGHGECTQGKCTCSDSNFFVGLQCEHTCPGDPFFNTPCSGHGECRFDSSGAYCSCEQGWGTVSDCSCNSEESCGAPTRGQCSAEARGCVCNSGYDAATNCETCDEGYVDDGTGVCVACPGSSGDGPVCGGHGTCEFSAGAAVCACDANWAGASCDTCASTAYPKTDTEGNNHCLYYCESSETCNGSPCASDGTCACRQNFAGTNCSTCAPGFFPERGDNQCTVQCVDSGDEPTCIFGSCDEHGACVCDEGASGDNCEINCPTAVPGKVCSGHGECLYDNALASYTDSARIQTCQCDPTYYGDSCNHQPPMFNDLPCANNGKVSFATNNVECTSDGDCSDGFFCNSPLNPYQSLLAETDCDVKDNKCYDVINSADWASFCLRYYESTQPCPGVTAECARCNDDNQLYDVCKGTPLADDLCRHHVEQSSCAIDNACVYDVHTDECRTRRCTDVDAETPPSHCSFLHGRDELTYLKCIVANKLVAHEDIPPSPPVEVLDNDMYAAAAEADTDGLTCVDHTFNYQFSSGSKYQLRCLNGATTPIPTPSVTRPPGCFVEEVTGVGSTRVPADFNPYVSEYNDCKRSGLTSACGTSTSTVDYSRDYVRVWAAIGEGPVFVQTNTATVKIVSKILQYGATQIALTKEYVLIELVRDELTMTLRIDDNVIVTQPMGATTYNMTIADVESSMFVHSRSADTKECAEKFDQVADFTDLLIFTGQDVDCSEYDNTDKLAYCMLRTNRPECSADDAAWSSEGPSLTVAQATECFDKLEPWADCSNECMTKVYESVPCTTQCSSANVTFGASNLFKFCNSQQSFSVGRVPLSISTNPECMQGTCINTLENVSNAVLESFCEDYLKEEGKCTTLTCNCDAGYSGKSCKLTCPIGNGKTCSGNGQCMEPHNHPCFGKDRCSSDIFGTCKCDEGSGSACTIECQDCSFAPYTKRKSQHGACNSEFGVCEVLPPGMVFDYEGARSEGRNVEAIPFNRDGSIADTSEFKVMNVSEILSQVRRNNCGNGDADTYATEKVSTTTKTKKQILDAIETHPSDPPYTYIASPVGWSQSAPDSWTEISGCYSTVDGSACLPHNKTTCAASATCRWYSIPVSQNTSTSVFLNTYTFEKERVEQDCIAYPMVKKILQMQGRFNMDSLLEFYQLSPNWGLSGPTSLNKGLKTRLSDPERTVSAGYAVTITLSSDITEEDDGEVYPDPIYIIDAIRTDDSVNAGSVSIKIDNVDYPISFSGKYVRVFLKGCMDSILGTERLCNGDTSNAVLYTVSVNNVNIDETVFVDFDKEAVFTGIYDGMSGICGLSSELTCPGSTTEFKVPCSGHGTCSRSSCQCTCDITPEKAAEPGAILNMKDFLDHSPYRGRACDKTCPGYDGISMDSVCSGRGVCNYRGVCQCEENYRGDNCEYTCPKLLGDDGNDVSVCSGHGLCELSVLDLNSLRHPHIEDYMNYVEDELPEVGDPVTEITLTFEKATVNDYNAHRYTYSVNMTCTRIDEDNILCAACKCDSTNANRLGAWDGAICSQCANTTYGPSCSSKCPDCGDYGVCDYGLTGRGVCLCGQTTHGGIVRNNTGDPENLSPTKYRRYIRDNTVHLDDDVINFDESEFNFLPGSNCKMCLDGFDGSSPDFSVLPNTCSGEALPCLSGGTALYLPSTDNECICRNGLFDPQNHCCPYGWGVIGDKATKTKLLSARLYSLKQLINYDGDTERICYRCPNTEYSIANLDAELTAMRSALAYSSEVCDGNLATPCKAYSDMMACDCPKFFINGNWYHINSYNCNEEPFASLLGTCPKGFSFDCIGQCSSNVECAKCSYAKYMDEEAHQQSCKDCPEGRIGKKFSWTGTNSYDKPIGTLSGTQNLITCPFCAPGWVGAGEPSSLTETDVPPSIASCTKCSVGFQENADGTACEACPAGFYGESNYEYTLEGVKHKVNHCQVCQTGQYRSDLTYPYCRKCSGGRYQNEKGQAYCKNCLAGQYQKVSGEIECESCPTGWYSDRPGLNFCKVCLAGKYQNQNGQTGCDSCAIGKYQNDNGQSSCKNCPNGQYQDQNGKTNCKGCGNCLNPNTYRCTYVGTNGLCINGCQGCLGL